MLQITAHSPAPLGIDAAPASGASSYGGTGSPDRYQSTGPVINTDTGDYAATITIQAPEVASGPWETSPEQFGPFGKAGAPAGTVDVHAYAYGEPFDRQVKTSTGDPWSPFDRASPPPTTLPGMIGAIRVRITPRGAVGTVVRGFLYLDTLNTGTRACDELAAIPYAYTIGKPGK